MRAEVVDYRSPIIEQRLDVDQLERPNAAPKDLFAGHQPTRSVQLGIARSLKVVSTGRPQDARIRSGRRITRLASQHLAQLGPSPRTDHDRLAAGEALAVGPKSPHALHEAVANEIDRPHASLLARRHRQESTAPQVIRQADRGGLPAQPPFRNFHRRL
jgi:hypothetical protein